MDSLLGRSFEKLSEVEDAAQALEQALLVAGGTDLQIRIHSADYLPEIVREDGDAQHLVHRLEGCDPKFWTVHRPEGAFTLGQPFAQTAPGCALSGRTIDEPAPLGIYFYGHPVTPEAAFREAPLLVHLWALATAVEERLDAVAQADAGQRTGVWRRLIELLMPQPTPGGTP